MEVADAMQGNGLGTILLGQLAEAANEVGVQVLDAEVMAENHRMIKVFRDSGFPVKTHTVPGVILVEFPTSLSPEALERFERREQVAAAAAMRAFFAPRLGGGDRCLAAARHRGRRAVPQPAGGRVQRPRLPGQPQGLGRPVGPGLQVRPGRARPGRSGRAGRAGPVRRPGRQRVRGQGRARHRGHLGRLRRDRAGGRRAPARAAGRLPGRRHAADRAQLPGDPQHRPARCAWTPPSGRSSRCPGGWGSCPRAAPWAWPSSTTPTRSGWGCRRSCRSATRPTSPATTCSAYWEQDERTALVLLYLESFGNPRKFARVARRVARTKPVLAVKSGRSAAGARATSSHTGALLAASDVTVDALFHQAGVIRTDTLAELFDVASLFANQPIPTGRRVGIVTNAGGPGIMCADACEAGGLEVVELSSAAPGQAARGPARRGGGGQPGRHAGLGTARALPTHGRAGGHLGRGRRRHRDLHPAPARRPGGDRPGDP